MHGEDDDGCCHCLAVVTTVRPHRCVLFSPLERGPCGRYRPSNQHHPRSVRICVPHYLWEGLLAYPDLFRPAPSYCPVACPTFRPDSRWNRAVGDGSGVRSVSTRYRWEYSLDRRHWVVWWYSPGNASWQPLWQRNQHRSAQRTSSHGELLRGQVVRETKSLVITEDCVFRTTPELLPVDWSDTPRIPSGWCP